MTITQNKNLDLNLENYTLDELLDIISANNIQSITSKYIEDQTNILRNRYANNPKAFKFFSGMKKLLLDIKSGVISINDEDGNEDSDEDSENENDRTKNVVQPKPQVVQKNLENPISAGNMNPLDRSTYTRNVAVDSIFRNLPLTTPAGDFNVVLPFKLENVVSMNVVSLDLPITWYNIKDDPVKNRISIQTYNIPNTSSLPVKHEITIPAGQYTKERLTNTINNIFSNTTTGLQYIYFEIDPITSKSAFRAKMNIDPGAATYPFDISNTYPDFRYDIVFPSVTEAGNLTTCDPNSATNEVLPFDSIGWVLGFRDISYSVQTTQNYVDNTSVTGNRINKRTYQQSESIYRDNINDYVFLEIDDHNNNFITNTIASLTKNGYIGNNIIARIPITKNGENTVNINKGDNIFRDRKYFGPVNIERMSIRLLDKYGEVIDLQGSNFSFELEFTLKYS